MHSIAKNCHSKNEIFDDAALTEAVWGGVRVRIAFHKANKEKPEPKPVMFPNESTKYWTWKERLTNALRAYYCPEGLCTLNALNKDPHFDAATCNNPMVLRDHKFVLNGAVCNLLSGKLFLFLSKCSRDSPAQALVDEFDVDEDGISALNSIISTYEQAPQVRARKHQLERELGTIVFRGDGTDDINDYTSTLTKTFRLLHVVGKEYSDDEKVNEHLLPGVKTENRAVADVAAIKANCRQLHEDNFPNACTYLNGQIGAINALKKTKSVAGRSRRNISDVRTVNIRHHVVPLSGRIPTEMYNNLTREEKDYVDSIRDPPPGGRGRGRGRGRRSGRGRGGGRGHGGYGNYNNHGRGFGRGRGHFGRGGRGGGRGGRFNNNNRSHWNNGNGYNNGGRGNFGNNGQWNNGGQNNNDQRQINEANAHNNGNQHMNNGGNAGNHGRAVQWADQGGGRRPDHAQSGGQPGNGNRGGQAGNAFGRGAYRN